MSNDGRARSKAVYVIVCNHLGDDFPTREAALEGIQKLADLTGLPKNDFDFLALYPSVLTEDFSGARGKV